MQPVSPEERARIMQWRRGERQRLIEARLRMSASEHQLASARIAAQLDAVWRNAGRLVPGTVVSAYWPLRGEPDLRPWLGDLHDQGLTCVLPVVVERGAPLQFRRWSPGCAMQKGIWNIPVPVEAAAYTPELLVSPVVGFDDRCYRLGYGGGYFDRTLAQFQSHQRRFHVMGVGYAFCALQSIQPLPHDIPLHGVVTEERCSVP